MGTLTRLAVAALVAVATGVAVWLVSGEPLAAGCALAGTAAAVALVLALPGAGGTAPAAVTATAAVTAPAGAGPGDVGGRGELITACLYVRDRLTSAALAQRLDQALERAGVTLLDPIGERFDPARHEAGGTTPAPDPALAGTVALVEVPGYADHGTLLRAPVVTVYQNGSGTPS